MMLLQSYNHCMPVHCLKIILTCIYLMVQKGSNPSQGYLSLGKCCGRAPFYQLALHSELARGRMSGINLIFIKIILTHKAYTPGDYSYTSLILLGIDVSQYKGTVSQVCFAGCSKDICTGNRICADAHSHRKRCVVLPVSVLSTLLAGFELFDFSLMYSCKIKTLIKDLSTKPFNFQDRVIKFVELLVKL